MGEAFRNYSLLNLYMGLQNCPRRTLLPGKFVRGEQYFPGKFVRGDKFVRDTGIWIHRLLNTEAGIEL